MQLSGSRFRRLLAAVMLGGSVALAACGGNDTDAGGGVTQTAATGTTPAAGVTGNPSVPPNADPSKLKITLEPVIKGFTRPVFVTSAPGDERRMFVVEKAGRIRIVLDGAIADTPFLDIKASVLSDGNEQGLLGLAFHPAYATNGRFFVYYTGKTAGAGDNTIAEFNADPESGVVAPNSGKILLAVPDFASNHNGGMLAFGPDGFLYAGIGDGGAAGDPRGNGQDKSAFMGKILRLDVDNVPAGAPYGIPPTNPFVTESGARPEIWAYGLRNPWRFSFDRAGGDLYIADVGQNKWEEVNYQPASSKGGENYGWKTVEGPDCFSPEKNCSRTGLVAPVASYSHSDGCSVTGGYVYRGMKQPLMQGLYIYADYCSGIIWALPAGGAGDAREVGKVNQMITSFGEVNGELYALGDSDGTLYRVIASAK